MFKLLIDECLSTELAQHAKDSGHSESTHVNWLGKSGYKDWQLMKFIIAGDWTFVTNNSCDFRGAAESRGSKGHYSTQFIHAGLVCLNWPPSLASLHIQKISFSIALHEIEHHQDLTNKCLEVYAEPDHKEIIFNLLMYDLPLHYNGIGLRKN